MFLTRIGFNSKAVITGDPSQIDLPRNVRSGLRHAMEVLKDVDEISFTYFLSDDVVRHPVVAAIVNAYEAYDKLHANDEERERRPRRPRPEHQAEQPQSEQLQAEPEVAAESTATENAAQ